MAGFDNTRARQDIPQLLRSVRSKPLVYLDNGATTLKPQIVIDRVARYYREENSNVHRGAHWLAENGTGLYERARDIVGRFVGAKESRGIVFTRGTTESLNLVAQTLALLGASDKRGLRAGDEVLVTELEHHSNIVPWQLACERVGAKLRAVPITDRGEIDLAKMEATVSEKTKVIAFASCSNVLGSILDPREVVKIARKVGAITVVDAAQAVTAGPIDVEAWGVDFIAFSGHKVYAPFGIGVLWGKSEWLDLLPPYQGGGSMIDSVTFEKTTWADVPQKFEAGTPNVGGAIGLGESIEWFEAHDKAQAIAHAKKMAELARTELSKIDGITVYGDARERSSIVSFNLKGAHASDVGSMLDQQGIAIRAGHHCCQPLMKRLGVPATARASFSLYNNTDDVSALLDAVKKAKEILI